MAVSQPTAGNNFSSPDHALSHRIIASDPAAPVQSIAVQGDGTVRMGATTGANFASIEPDGTLKFDGAGTVWEDLRIDGMLTRPGTPAPTDETGFRGNASFLVRNLVNNQADEIQFAVQFPHAVKTNSILYPHVHFSPWISNVGNAAAQFIFEYFWIDINGQFPASPGTLTLTKTWSGDQQWYHLLATNGTGINHNPKAVSSVMQCRLYRDNTVANNLAGKVTLLYFDIHYEIDTVGSRTETAK